jgi:hypothetical protein
MNRRDYVAPAVVAVLDWWRTYPSDEASLGWWASDDASEMALEVVHVVLQAIEHAGYEVVKIREEPK